MVTEATVEAMQRAIENWRAMKNWRDSYQHEDVLGEYSKRLDSARERMLARAAELVAGEDLPPAVSRLLAAALAPKPEAEETTAR